MEVYWHGLTFFIVIIIIIVLIMEIVNYCTLTKVKSELCLLAQSELYDLAPYGHGHQYGYRGNHYRRGHEHHGHRGNQYKYYYGGRRSSRRRSSSHCKSPIVNP